MADRLNDALEPMLAAYDARRRADLERERTVSDEEAAFLAQFAALRRDVVRPVFQSAGAALAAHGHRFEITEEEYARDASGKVVEAGISLRVMPAGTTGEARPDEQANTFSIGTRHYNKSVWFSAGRAMNAGGIAGSKGAYAPARVDRVLVEDELVKFIAGVIAA